MNIAESFCLKEGRRNFHINVRSGEIDRRVYFGRKDLNMKLTKQIRQKYDMGMPPKKYLYGEYGSGKTHTLFNVKYQLEESPEANDQDYRVRCIFIEGEFRKKTTFRYLHGQILEGIGLDEVKNTVSDFVTKHANEDIVKLLRKRFNHSNIAKAFHQLSVGIKDVTLWKWLCGGSLTPAELSTMNLTKNLDSTDEMVGILVGLSTMFMECKIHLLFLLDELEGLHNVGDDDARRSFHDAFRRFFDDSNDSAGVIVSIIAANDSEIPRFIFEPDIISRLGRDNIEDIGYLQEEEEVKRFLMDLFDLVIDQEKLKVRVDAGEIPPETDFYPLSADAMEQIIELAIQAPGASLPRNIIRAVNEAASQAAMDSRRIINHKDVENISNIFQEEQ